MTINNSNSVLQKIKTTAKQAVSLGKSTGAKTRNFFGKLMDFEGRKKARISQWEEAASQGSEEAAYKLAMLYFEEETEFYPLAFLWSKRLAEQGEDCGVMLQVAQMYEQGHGTEKDAAQALKWYERCLTTHILKGKNSRLSLESENFVQKHIVDLRKICGKN